MDDEQGYFSPTEETDHMNAPFLTGAGSSSDVLASNFSYNAADATATPPCRVIAPSSIHSSPHEHPIKSDYNNDTDNNTNTNANANANADRFGNIDNGVITTTDSNSLAFHLASAAPVTTGLQCVSCGNFDCMIPTKPHDEIATGLHHQHRMETVTQPETPNEWYHTWGFVMPDAQLDMAHFPAYTPNGLVTGGVFPGFGSMNGQGGALPSPFNDDGTLSLASTDSSTLEVESSSASSTYPPSLRKRLPSQPTPSYQNLQPDIIPLSDDTITVPNNTNTNTSPLEDTSPPSSQTTCSKHGSCRLNNYSCTSERQSKDEFLIACRARGMTYRDIKKMGKMTEAESTLRGRHRVLTKDKRERLRSPKWTDTDVQILREVVRRRTFKKTKGKKAYIAWGKVSLDMAAAGCSYPFGAIACSNKWSEITQ